MHIKHLAGLALATLTALGLSATPAAAQTTVFSTFGPGNSFSTGIGYGESVTAITGPAFSPSATGVLSSVTVAYFHLNGTDDAHLYLTDSFSNLGNNLGNPGTSLESFVFTPPADPGAVVTLPSVQHPLLTAGHTYYLYDLETGTEDNNWNLSNPPVNGAGVSGSGPYTFVGNFQLPAFSIQEASPATSSVVPESSGLANLSGALLALALAGMVTAIKKRKKQAP